MHSFWVRRLQPRKDCQAQRLNSTIGEKEKLWACVCVAVLTLSVTIAVQKVVYSATDGESLLVCVMLVHSVHCLHAVSAQEQK